MTQPDQPAPALLDVITDALIAHRVDREGPDFDHADASLLGYARAVTAAMQPLIERGVAEGRRQATDGCSCTVAGGPDPETPLVEENPRCPEHGDAARHKHDSERLWQLYGQLADAMGIDAAEPFPAVDVFAEAVRRVQATEDWERQWAVAHVDGGWVYAYESEADARAHCTVDWHRVVSRLVGPWEPTEQDGADRG